MARSSRQAQIVRNKRNVARVRTIVTDNKINPDLSIADNYNVTALATSITIHAPLGNPRDHERLVFRIKDDSNAQSLSWDAIYRGSVPTVTNKTDTLYVEFLYNDAELTWDCIISTSLV